MSDLLRDAVLATATVTMGLNAGLFYTFAMCVMPGLRRADDRTFVHAMQRINAAILNGWFVTIFAGPGVLTLVAAGLQLGADDQGELPFILGGLAWYGVMLCITMGINVPLNNQLDAAVQPDQITGLRAAREQFEGGWVRWNIVRTVVSTAAFGCLAWALALA